MTATATATATASVSLRGRTVGWLDYFAGEEAYRLEFAPGWLSDPDREVLAQQYEDLLPEPVESRGLPQWFQEILPQGPLRGFLTRRLGLEEFDEFELLLALGADLPGAVTVAPCAPRSTARRPQVPPPRPPPSPGMRLAFSLAGVQWKLSVKKNGRGLVVPARGEGGDWIAKFHDPTYPDLPRIEFATTEWAAASGIPTPATRLGRVEEFEELPPGIPLGDGTVFLSERFDRAPLVHMEDFAQVLGRADQFRGTAEEVGVVLHALDPRSTKTYIERLVFFTLCGNGDAHLKNWAIRYPDGRTAELSPAYDIVPTILFLEGQGLVLPLGGTSEFGALTLRSFRRLAEVCRLPLSDVQEWGADMETRTRRAWKDGRPFSLREEEARRIDQHLGQVTLGGAGS
ncbi:MAG: type II toxin-antitoxin system HipA family toxin [Pseudomonadota bacterium]